MKIHLVYIKYPDGTKNVEAFFVDHNPEAASRYLASQLNNEPGSMGKIKTVEWSELDGPVQVP